MRLWVLAQELLVPTGRKTSNREGSEQWRMAMEDRWLSVDEIASHLGVKRDTVYKWIRERQLPGHKIGRLWKFDRKQIDEWVKSGGANETEPGSRGDR